MRAHLVQLDIAWHDKPRNYAKVEDLLESADVSPGDLVVLPEMFDTGFSWDTTTTADKNGATLAFLSELSTDLGALVIGGRTIHDCHCIKARNVVSALAPGGALVGQYAKSHLFPIGEEARHLEPGRGVEVFQWPRGETPETEGFIIAPAICYDLRFPEVFRAGLARGAELFVVPACWLEGRHAHWRALLIARAIENQAYVLGCNRTGKDPNASYLGGSIAISPRGDVLGELGPEEGVLSVDIDPREVRAWRQIFPAWKDAQK